MKNNFSCGKNSRIKKGSFVIYMGDIIGREILSKGPKKSLPIKLKKYKF